MLTACNNDKGTNNRDDRNSSTRNNGDKNNDQSGDRDSRENTDYRNDEKSGNSNWTSTEKNKFIDACTDEAVKGGFTRSKAEDYCSCMQQKLENKFPDTKDVARLDMETPEMKRLVNDCLGISGGSSDEDRSRGEGWTRSNEDKFVNDCISTAKKNVGQSRAEEYCECMLRKVKRKYASYNEAEQELSNITREELDELAADCNR